MIRCCCYIIVVDVVDVVVVVDDVDDDDVVVVVVVVAVAAAAAFAVVVVFGYLFLFSLCSKNESEEAMQSWFEQTKAEIAQQARAVLEVQLAEYGYELPKIETEMEISKLNFEAVRCFQCFCLLACLFVCLFVCFFFHFAWYF
jgi:hypothetical protein